MSAVEKPDVRAIDVARREAVEAVTRYVELSRAWNAPDDEHTRWQARRLVDEAIQDVMHDLAPPGFHDEH